VIAVDDAERHRRGHGAAHRVGSRHRLATAPSQPTQSRWPCWQPRSHRWTPGARLERVHVESWSRRTLLTRRTIGPDRRGRRG